MFTETLGNCLNNVMSYEDDEKIHAALEVIPFDMLTTAAAEIPEPGSPQAKYSEMDRMIIHLLQWFKGWFKWINAPACDVCQSDAQMEHVYQDSPLDEESRYGARIAEVWRCRTCTAVNGGNPVHTRFPRYNDCVKLLSYRQGRCGEWCNVMHLLLRALGRDTRYVWNSEDHVWNEIWSPDQQRWIHVDGCEAAFDAPLTYSDGWGKKMAYVIGFSINGVRDITPRYVRRPEMQLPRRLTSEANLNMGVTTITTLIRQNMKPEEKLEWERRDALETAELARLGSKTVGQPTRTDLPARQSGSKEWTESRGEAGSESLSRGVQSL